jgi:hypothetical protein
MKRESIRKRRSIFATMNAGTQLFRRLIRSMDREAAGLSLPFTALLKKPLSTKTCLAATNIATSNAGTCRLLSWQCPHGAYFLPHAFRVRMNHFVFLYIPPRPASPVLTFVIQLLPFK